MPFQPGNRANPGGRPKDQPFRDALRIAIKEASADGRTKLRELAEKTVQLALAGDMQAIKEVADRLDGKPVQAIETSAEHTHYVIAIPSRVSESQEWVLQQQIPIQ